MGKIIYIMILFFVYKGVIYGQEKVIIVKKTDTIELQRRNDKREYLLTIFYKKNKEYNKINGFKYDTLIDGRVSICSRCRKEEDFFLLTKKHYSPKYFSKKYYTLEQVISMNSEGEEYFNIKFFNNSYIIIEGIFYRLRNPDWIKD